MRGVGCREGVLHGIGRIRQQSPRSWLTAHDYPASANPVRVLRAALKAVIRGQAEPATLAPFLADVQSTPTMTDAGVQWRLDEASAGSVAVQAILAWDTVNTTSPGRLRPCANSECELFLIDRSKANTARWCSMALCGNRMKARRHYQRSKT